MLSAAELSCQVQLGDRPRTRLNNLRMTTELWERIFHVRSKMGKTQETFGAALGVSKAAVAQWESKSPRTRTAPATAKLQAMARMSGVSIAWLIDGLDDDANHAREELATYNAPSLESALAVVLNALAHLPSARWASVRAQLDQYVQIPDQRAAVSAELHQLLTWQTSSGP
jgi:transcriptional regulator with XRE-family HTH domain